MNNIVDKSYLVGFIVTTARACNTRHNIFVLYSVKIFAFYETSILKFCNENRMD